MDRELVKRRLLEILASPEFRALHIDPSHITEETSLLNEIGFDSLQLLDLVVAMERAFAFRANTRRLNIEIFDRFGNVVDFVVSVGAGEEPHVEQTA